jgi:CheY-like chemotaxis protein
VIADGDAEIRNALTEYLRTHGCPTFSAANGLEALLHVKQQRPTAVVLDLHMPRLGAIEALKSIRAFDPTIAVVIVGDRIDDAVRRQADALGASAVLNKPVELERLLAAVGADATSSPLTRPADAPAAAPSARPASVLVVDDNADIRDVLEELLTMKGYRVRVSADGADAVRQLVAAAPDVVLLDITMPGLSGVEALPTIRALAPSTAVIMVSGTMDVELAKRALAAGAFDYVTKPVELPHLLESIETALAMGALRV